MCRLSCLHCVYPSSRPCAGDAADFRGLVGAASPQRPTTSPAPMRLVLVTKSRRLRRWLSDLLAVAARSRLGISCSHRSGFNVSNVAGEPRRCLPDPRCLLPEMTILRGNREWRLRRDLDSLYTEARAGYRLCKANWAIYVRQYDDTRAGSRHREPCPNDGDYNTSIPSLTLHRRSGPTEPLHCIYNLGLGVVAQGDKQVLLGEESID